MRYTLKTVFTKIPDNVSVMEYFEIRNVKISFGFVGILTAFLAGIVPVLLFVIKYPVGAFATAAGLVVGIVSLFFVLKVNSKLGCAFMITFMELAILFVYYNALVLSEHKETAPLVVITLIALSIIVLIPSGILIGKRYPIIFGLLYGASVLVIMKISGLKEFIDRMPLFGASYGIAAVLIYYITRIQDEILEKATKESEKSVRSLTDIRSIVKRMRSFKGDLDQSQDSILNELERIDDVFKSNNEILDAMFSVYDNLSKELSTTKNSLDLFLNSIWNITNQIENQKKIVDSNHASQETMLQTIEDIASNVKRTDEINTRLNQIAETGRDQLTRSIKTIEDLGEYQKRLQDIVNILTTVTQETNVLALNASIEASHAGSVGRGFAIVAKEIKELAKTSGKHTKDISLLINEMNAKISDSVGTVRNVGGMLIEITDNVKVSYESVARIAGSMSDFTERSRQMFEEIKQLVTITSNINENASKGDTISAEFVEGFKSFEGFFEQFNEIITRMKEYGEQSVEILKNVSIIKNENAVINTNMNELLQNSNTDTEDKIQETA